MLDKVYFIHFRTMYQALAMLGTEDGCEEEDRCTPFPHGPSGP